MSLSTSSISYPFVSFEPKASERPPILGEFDPRSVHPASIIPLSEMSDLTEQVVQNKLDEIHPASLPSPTHLVRDGYGELVLRVKEGATLRPVTKEEYAKAYLIFQKYAPRLEEHPRPLAKTRIEMMREELRTINPNMVATFIPRTLHDLLFIRKSIEEDVEKESRFSFKDPGRPTPAEIHDFLAKLSENSWFRDPIERSTSGFFPRLEINAPSDVEKHLPALIDIGYRLNLEASKEIDRLGANIEDLSLHQIQELIDDQINFLERFVEGHAYREHFKSIADWHAPLCDFLLGHFTRSKIGNKEKIGFLKKTAFIECQESMAGKILFYRGGSLVTDSPVKNGKNYSLSFGSGLFPGIVNDRGSCAYYHMFHLPDSQGSKDDAYILVLDPLKESSHAFYIPPYTALESLFGSGQTWHNRFRCSKDVPDYMDGINPFDKGFKDYINKMIKLGLMTAPTEQQKRNAIFRAAFGMNLSGQDDIDKTEIQMLDLIKGPLTIEQTVDKFEDLKEHSVILLHHSTL